jgi:hypothetical protein
VAICRAHPRILVQGVGVTLKRGLQSRLLGDAVSVHLSTQVALGVGVLIWSGDSGLWWLPALFLPPALFAFLWGARIDGHDLVARVLFVELYRIDLTRSGRPVIAKEEALRGATVRVVEIDDAWVKTVLWIPLKKPKVRVLKLRYTRYMSAARLSTWTVAIRDVQRNATASQAGTR